MYLVMAPATFIFQAMEFGIWTYAHMYIRAKNHVTTKVFSIELPNFLRYGAPLTRLRFTGARYYLNFLYIKFGVKRK